MGCVTSYQKEMKKDQHDIDSYGSVESPKSASSDRQEVIYDPIYNAPVIVNDEGIIDSDNQLLQSFINKYKLDQISSSLYIERITVKFLLSQNKQNIDQIAKQLTSNIIQQNKFKYGVSTEKKKRKFRQKRNQNVFIKVYMRSIDDKLLSLYVCTNDLIKNIKIMYQEKQHIPVETQLLTFCGTPLLNDKSLLYYGITNDSEIYVNYKNGKTIAKCITITVQLQTSIARTNAFISNSFVVSDSTKIEILKKMIQKEWGIGTQNQRLSIYDEQLDDNKTIKYYNIKKNDIIYLIEQIGLYTIIINIKNEQYLKYNITICVESNDIIKNIKTQIKLYLNIPIKKQILIHCNKELNNKQTVSQSKILDGNTLYLIIIN